MWSKDFYIQAKWPSNLKAVKNMHHQFKEYCSTIFPEKSGREWASGNQNDKGDSGKNGKSALVFTSRFKTQGWW